MSDRFLALHAFLQRCRAAVFAGLALAVTAAVAGLFALPFDSSLLVMLPDAGPVRRAMEFLQEAQFSDKVAFAFENADPQADRGTFLARTEEFIESVKSPWLRPLSMDFSQADTVSQAGFFLRQMPAILEEQDLAHIAERMEPTALDTILRERYIQLLKPEGSFLAASMRRDPLDMQGLILERLHRMTSTFAYGATLERNLFVSADGRHAMRVFETSASMTDTSASAELVADVNRILAGLPFGLRADAVCGHAHTVGNRQTIESDIRRMLLIATTAFLVLFLICFRDPAALWIFLFPFGAVVLSLHAVSWLRGTLSALVVGLGSVVAGIAVDYGIHVFVAVKRDGAPSQSVRAIVKPVCFGAMTTLSVFVAFLFSGVEGYRQLGWFSGTSIVIALGLALFVLPLTVRQGGRIPFGFPLRDRFHRRDRISESGTRRTWALRLTYALAMLGALLLARDVAFDSDLKALDGAGERVLNAERRFSDTWTPQGSGQAFLTVAADEYAEAEQLNQRMADEAVARLGDKSVLSWATLWPAPERRLENVERWTRFWSDPARTDRLKEMIATQGTRHGFSPSAFEPFWTWIREPPPNPVEPENNMLFNRLRDRFVLQTQAGWHFSTWFPDTEEAVRLMTPLLADRNDAFLVSPAGLSDIFSDMAVREMGRMATIALALMLATMLLVFRNVRLGLAAIMPAATGIVFMLAGMAVLDHALNVANMIAGIVVVGLCMDYGIFVAYARQRGLESSTVIAVTLSAATTLVGSGALLFARHPALFSIGLTLTLGIGAGYLAAILVLPALMPAPSTPATEDLERQGG